MQRFPTALAVLRKEVDKLVDLALIKELAMVALVTALAAAFAFLALALRSVAFLRTRSRRIARRRLTRVARVFAESLGQRCDLLEELRNQRFEISDPSVLLSDPSVLLSDPSVL
jgi:hypothetical protein